MTISKSDKAMEYAGYARHCLKIVAKIPDQASRIKHREMAAAWFKLAEQVATDAAVIVIDSPAPKINGAARS
jgi:hypothetical protein